jgi:hypothetical protein
LVGDHTRLPEYSAGIETVSVSPDGETFVCRFRATDQTPAFHLTEQIRWEIPGVGYGASAVEPKRIPAHRRPVRRDGQFRWCRDGVRVDPVLQSNELVAAIQSFNEGLTDMAEQLVARFGGRVMAQWAHNPNEATHA